MNNQRHGAEAEDYFSAELCKRGIDDHEFVNEWYDFEVMGYKVEVKSSLISIKHSCKKYNHYRIGRFDFTSKENRQLMKDNKVWICFIVRINKEHVIFGLIRADKIHNSRYVTLHQLRSFKCFTLDNWIKKIRRDKHGYA